MRNLRYGFWIGLFCAFLTVNVIAEIELNPVRVTENILVVQVGFHDGSTIAINTDKGIIVVDTTAGHSLAARVRKIIEKEFKRNDFAYVINTHFHYDHVNGNQIFKDAKIIAHENTPEEMKPFIEGKDETIKNTERAVAYLKRMRDERPKGTFDNKLYQSYIDRRLLIKKDLSEGFEPVYPEILVKDKYHLDMGSLNIHIKHYPSAHSKGDLMLFIPEEKTLIVGDFGGEEYYPIFINGVSEKLPVAEWLNILDGYLEGDKLMHVIDGHGGIYNKDFLQSRRNYLASLWKDVEQAFKDGYKYSDLKRKLRMYDDYNFFPNSNINSMRMREFHNATIKLFWGQFEKDGIGILTERIEKAGNAEGVESFKKILVDGNQKIFLDEDDLNRLGYRYLQQGRPEIAVAVFRLMTDLYPGSTNDCDSLGEALLANGNKEEGLRAYMKSWEYAPWSRNAKALLDRELPGWKERYKPVMEKFSANIFKVNAPFALRTNSLIIKNNDTALVVDPGMMGCNFIIEKALAGLGIKKVDVILNTHLHGDHTSGNSIAKDAKLISYKTIHSLVRSGYVKEGDLTFSTEKGELASVYYTYDYRGEKLVFIPSPDMHSNDDMLIYIPGRKILLMGDLLLSESFPAVGSNVSKYLGFMGGILQVVPDDVRFIGGHGRSLNFKEIKNYYDELQANYDYISKEVNAGKTDGEIMNTPEFKSIKKTGNFLTWLNEKYWLRAVRKSVRKTTEASDRDLNTKLMGLVEKNDVEALRNVFLEKPWLVNYAPPHGFTLLHQAVEQRETFEYLLKMGADTNALTGASWTPLHSAAYRGSVFAIEALVKKGAKIDQKQSYGMTPLMSSVVHNRLEAAGKLIELGAGLNFHDTHNRTALAISAQLGFEKIAELIMKSGADPSIPDIENRNALHWAAIKGHLTIVKILLKSELDLNTKDAKGMTPFDYALKNSHTNCAEKIAARYKLEFSGS